MANRQHEVRDPVHVFINYDDAERAVIDSAPFQRLRHIHQLAMTYLVYPGATHRRFEHSLGVMHLASEIFDTLTRPQNLEKAPKSIRDVLSDDRAKLNWRLTLRLAALCHDLGHLPFSHAAENELLPEGHDHETMTVKIITEGMVEVWGSIDSEFGPSPETIAKIAVGPKKFKGSPFKPIETLLSEIIIHDVFGADRMDYLIRDSLHCGVKYGNFDYQRLIDTMRILTYKTEPDDETEEPALGVERGGLEVAESLLMARYLVFSQVLFHHVRRIYDIHLAEFLKEWLPKGLFDVDLADYLRMTDNEVLCGIRSSDGIYAERIKKRNHFRLLCQISRQDSERVLDVLDRLYGKFVGKYGVKNVRKDNIQKRSSLDPESNDFPVLAQDGRILRASGVSDVITKLPNVLTGYLFVSQECKEDAKKMLKHNFDTWMGQWEKEV